MVAIAGIRKKLKDVGVVRFSSFREKAYAPVVGWVKTGCWPIDWLFGDFRGVPLGKLTLVWGAESTGKSALALVLLQHFQKVGAAGLWFDYDQSLDPAYFQNAKIDEDRLLLADVSTVEEGIDAIDGAVTSLYAPGGKTGKSKRGKDALEDEEPAAPTTEDQKSPLLVVWDSVASSPSQFSMDKSAEENANVASVAKAFGDQLPKLRQRVKRTPVHLLFINEARDMIGGMSFGPTERIARGGRALKHNASTVLRMQLREQLKKDKDGRKISTGCVIKMVAQKARFGVRNREAEFVLSYSKTKGGIKVAASNYRFLDTNNLLKPAGKAGVSIKGVEEAGTFKEADFPTVLKEHRKAIEKMLRERLSAKDPIEKELGDSE